MSFRAARSPECGNRRSARMLRAGVRGPRRTHILSTDTTPSISSAARRYAHTLHCSLRLSYNQHVHIKLKLKYIKQFDLAAVCVMTCYEAKILKLQSMNVTFNFLIHPVTNDVNIYVRPHRVFYVDRLFPLREQFSSMHSPDL